jgi:hypothetical protein
MTRVDLFSTIHKGVRALLFSVTNEAARVDLSSNRAVDDLLAQIERMLELLNEHEVAEHAEILPLLEMLDPTLAETLVRAHDDLEAAGQGVERAVMSLDIAPPEERSPHMRELRQALDHFAVKCLSHLSHEETVVSAVLWGAFGDPQLVAVHDRIVARLGEKRVSEWCEILDPVLAPSDRAPTSSLSGPSCSRTRQG